MPQIKKLKNNSQKSRIFTALRNASKAIASGFWGLMTSSGAASFD
jgi:ribosomal protein S20